MKELSIEEKARAYDEALERAKNYWKSPRTCFDINALTEMFHELAESEDEKIRKEILEYFQQFEDGELRGVNISDWIAWLEKQSKETSWKPSKEQDKALDYAFNSLPDTELGNYYEGVLLTLIEDLHWLEKQGEKPADKVEPIFRVGDYIRNKKTGDKVLIEQLDIVAKAYCYVNYDGAAVNHSDFPFVKQDEWELLGNKVAEQKLAEDSAKVSESSIEEKDMTEYKKGFECGKQRVLKYPEDFGLCKKSDGKIEPKFHEGDWLISNNKKSIYQVIEVKRGIYVVRDNADNHEYHIGIEESEKSGRLWTIQDAKDGDVLYSPSHRLVWIYKDKEHYYTCVNMNYVTENVATDGLISVPNDTCPATKDERTILFEKIKEAGYELDAEKKELKKVEQLP